MSEISLRIRSEALSTQNALDSDMLSSPAMRDAPGSHSSFGKHTCGNLRGADLKSENESQLLYVVQICC